MGTLSSFCTPVICVLWGWQGCQRAAAPIFPGLPAGPFDFVESIFVVSCKAVLAFSGIGEQLAGCPLYLLPLVGKWLSSSSFCLLLFLKYPH